MPSKQTSFNSQNTEGGRRWSFAQQTVQPKYGYSWTSAAGWEAGGKTVFSVHSHQSPHPAGMDSLGCPRALWTRGRIKDGLLCPSLSLLIAHADAYWMRSSQCWAKEWKCSSSALKKMSFCYRYCKVESATGSDVLISWINRLECSAVNLLLKDH